MTIKNIEVIHIAPGELDDEKEPKSTTGFFAVRDADDGDRELGVFVYAVKGVSSETACASYPTRQVAARCANDFATLMRIGLRRFNDAAVETTEGSEA